MDKNRRRFLKGAGALAASTLLPMQFAMRNAHAATGNKKQIVFNFHGGNDGLNLAVPIKRAGDITDTQYDLYSGYRPTIAVPRLDLLPVGADEGGMEFGLNPAMSALEPYFDRLAIFPATHSTVGTYNANRSHFYQMDVFGSGISGSLGDRAATDGKGWVGRYFDKRYLGQTSGIIGQDFTDAVHFTFKGETFLLNLKDPSNVALGAPSESQSTAIWNDIKDISDADIASYAGKYKAEQTALNDEVFPRLGTVNFNRAANASYTAGSLGSTFKRAADMLLDLPELEIIHINLGGFYTHLNQGAGVDSKNGVGNQAMRFKMIAESVAALYDDLSVADSVLRSDTVVTFQSEFGRTIRENGTFGTDHGHASCWMAFGDSIAGGVYGTYAGLEPENLNGSGSDWLQPTIDYRDIFSEVLSSHLGYTDANSTFPGYTGAANPLNFVV